MDEYEVQIERPHVEGRKDCHHEPRCPSNEWHSIMVKRDQDKSGAA
jgi:hypothetical protein